MKKIKFALFSIVLISVGNVAAQDLSSTPEDQPIYNAEEMPTFQGGDLNSFRKWVYDRIQYPRIAQENGIQGRVTLRFVIERDGTLTNIEEFASPDKSLTDEAIRVLRQSPKWSPGKMRNKPVRIWYVLPIEFQLQQ